MPLSKAALLAQLQKEILPLQGLKPSPRNFAVDAGVGILKNAFPNTSFPLGVLHEFVCTDTESATASFGFVAAVLSSLMQTGSASLWITSSRTIFPPALKRFGVEPHGVVFVYHKKEKEGLWAVEEALKCGGLCAVVGEVREIGFTESRRLQLATERSGVTAFLVRENPSNLATAAVARWRVTTLASTSEEGMPGLSFPSWKVELLKVRNGRPHAWQLQWADGKFRPVLRSLPLVQEAKRKAG